MTLDTLGSLWFYFWEFLGVLELVTVVNLSSAVKLFIKVRAVGLRSCQLQERETGALNIFKLKPKSVRAIYKRFGVKIFI